MRPIRSDIAAPPFPPRTRWLGAEREPSMERLTAAGPVLVHFFDFAELNGVRTLPYVRAWHERYAHRGLAVLGVHTPRFPFTADEDRVAAALDRLTIPYPVAVDEGRSIWRDYGCRGWPSLFLWGRGGALRWYHFGQGEYGATEAGIQAELEAGDGEIEMPEPVAPMRPEDAPGARVIAPTSELLPGGSVEEPWSPGSGQLEVDYEAAGVHASVDGAGRLDVEIDDGVPRSIEVTEPGLVELADHGRHGEHRLALRAAGPRVWSISFAPGLGRAPRGSPSGT